MIQKSHIWNSFFENIILLIRRFYNCSDVPVDIIRVFFNFSFSNRKPQSQQKLAKKDHTFYNTVLLKKLQSFYEPQLTWHWKWYSMLPQRSQKPFWLYKFSANMFFFGVRKKYLYCTISWRPRTALWKQMPVYFFISP